MHRWYSPPIRNSKLNRWLRRANKIDKIPTRLWRKLWHLAGGLFFPALALFVSREALLITVGAITGLFILFEAVRFAFPGIKRWITSHLGIVLKREEQVQPTGTTLLLLASLVVFFLFEKDIAIMSLLFVAVGDPIASLIGEKYGKHTVFNKSLEGSLACLISCLAVGMIMTRLSPAMSLLVVAYGALWATVVEILPIPVDDNFSMPLFSAGAMALASFYLV